MAHPSLKSTAAPSRRRLLPPLTVALTAAGIALGYGCSKDDSGAGPGGAVGGSASGAAPSAGGAGSGASPAAGGTTSVGASPGTGASSASGGTISTGGAPGTGGSGATGGTDSVSCGYMNQGKVLDVTADIQLCLPPTVCVPETCPPALGDCVNGECVFKDGYQGLLTLPEAWATKYCDLNAGTCNGVTQFQPPLTTATELAGSAGLPLCASASPGQKCVGIVASPPMMVGNSEVTKDPATGDYAALWGLGLTEAAGLCYELTGPGGSALVAVTDRCAGYCRCDGNDNFEECGFCIDSPDPEPKCPCVGSVPPLFDECCVRGEPILCGPRPEDDPLQACDWCASNNHPHFDVDDATFDHLCGVEADKGSCRLSIAKFVQCREPDPSWPPNR